MTGIDLSFESTDILKGKGRIIISWVGELHPYFWFFSNYNIILTCHRVVPRREIPKMEGHFVWSLKGRRVALVPYPFEVSFLRIPTEKERFSRVLQPIRHIPEGWRNWRIEVQNKGKGTDEIGAEIKGVVCMRRQPGNRYRVVVEKSSQWYGWRPKEIRPVEHSQYDVFFSSHVI